MAIIPRSNTLLQFACVLMMCSTILCFQNPSECLTAYKIGGSEAVFRSPECPHRNLADIDFSNVAGTPRCQIAMLKGQQELQEDRAICALDLAIPFPSGKNGFKDVKVDIAAIFDGHNGQEASEMASKLFLDYFSFHVHFLSEDASSVSNHLEVLKEALTRTIRDIDVTFTKEAEKRGLLSGSTAAIALMVDGQILTARVGNAKAFLCSKKPLSLKEQAKDTLLKLKGDYKDIKSRTFDQFVAKEMTKAEQPDEKIQEKAEGELVLDWAGVPRLEGHLPHSIGDVSYKRFGIVSTPETTEWQPLTSKDRFLVATSDGILEKMSLQDVCNVLKANPIESTGISSADHLVDVALKKGSMDNLSAVVIPIQSSSQQPQIAEDTRNGDPRRFEL